MPSVSKPEGSFEYAWKKIQASVEPIGAAGGPQIRLTVEGSLWAAEIGDKARAVGPSEAADVLSWLRNLFGRLKEGVQLGNQGLYVTAADVKKFAELGTSLPNNVYQVVYPRKWTFQIRGASYSFVDNVDVPLAYESFRSPRGVRHFGTPLSSMPREDFVKLVSSVTDDPSFLRVLLAVSSLEGGFDSVNSFDTGFLSVGILQFAALKTGAGSLGRLMLRFKASDPEDFHFCLGQYGLNVNDRGQIMAWDPERGSTLVGPEASLLFHREPVYAALFQSASRTSYAFRRSQLEQALHEYYPKGRYLRLKLGGVTVRPRVEEVLYSEAALACCMDHLVKTGSMSAIEGSIQSLISEGKIVALGDLAKHEREIITRSQLRRNFLQDRTLTQPQQTALR